MTKKSERMEDRLLIGNLGPSRRYMLLGELPDDDRELRDMGLRWLGIADILGRTASTLEGGASAHMLEAQRQARSLATAVASAIECLNGVDLALEEANDALKGMSPDEEP